MQDALHAPARTGRGADQIFTSHDRFSGAEGLAVYQRSFFLRLRDCLREQFPALTYALGPELFDDFTAEYLAACPPEKHTLYDLGRRFPGFLAETRPEAEAPELWVEFMLDLARFERAIFEMFDAPGQEGRGYAQAETPDEQLRLQPAFALGAYQFPVAHYYLQVRAGAAPSLPAPGPSHLALVRRDYLTRILPLTPLHFTFLAAMQRGTTVAQALSQLAKDTETALSDVTQAWLGPKSIRNAWIADGVFAIA